MSIAPQSISAVDKDWWRGAVIYQIYPRSYQDSNGDGIGDLKGIAIRLPHVAALGVDAIWVSPFFTSPMRDFGYDVSNYEDVDPIFGSLSDFDAMVAEAHRLGIKVSTRDDGALLEEAPDDGAADAAGGAGDERDLPVKSRHDLPVHFLEQLAQESLELKVHARTAERFGIHHLPHRAFHQVGTTEPHEAGAFHHDDDVAQSGKIRTARDARAHHGGNLRHMQTAAHQ